MPSYDFKQLSPHDFEVLSRDLIQARDGFVLESFKTGRDLGIDFRRAGAAGDIIVQCKHYAGTGLAGLMSELKKEAVKVSKLTPARYILVTSVGLSPPNKADIQALFGAVLVNGDILGADWGQVLDENRARLKFFQDHLDVQVDRDASLKYLQQRYAAYLEGVFEVDDSETEAEADAEPEADATSA
ncbi:restriction endonuclease [Paraburkholderia fungorum]|uniref:restriction endonuclease n=1 Tax=Paraburkholderia fungorum TaxID=134537 RepID=UPI0038BBFD98